VIELSGEDRQRLVSLVRGTAEHRMVVRARIVLAAANGEENASIALRDHPATSGASPVCNQFA
jgi:hypothetical protein